MDETVLHKFYTWISIDYRVVHLHQSKQVNHQTLRKQSEVIGVPIMVVPWSAFSAHELVMLLTILLKLKFIQQSASPFDLLVSLVAKQTLGVVFIEHAPLDFLTHFHTSVEFEVVLRVAESAVGSEVAETGVWKIDTLII